MGGALDVPRARSKPGTRPARGRTLSVPFPLPFVRTASTPASHLSLSILSGERGRGEKDVRADEGASG